MRFIDCKYELTNQFIDYFIANRELWTRLVDYPFFKSEKNFKIAEHLFSALGVPEIDNIFVFDFDLLKSLKDRVSLDQYFFQNCGVASMHTELEFHEYLPGYKATIKCWNTSGFFLILVEDFTGFYLYAVGENHLNKVGSCSLI